MILCCPVFFSLHKRGAFTTIVQDDVHHSYGIGDGDTTIVVHIGITGIEIIRRIAKYLIDDGYSISYRHFPIAIGITQDRGHDGQRARLVGNAVFL